MRFGWFDFIDDPAVSSALLQKVEDWALEKGMTAVHGPLGFTDLDREGMLIEGFDELGTLATIYNYPYYPQHMERLGYGKDTDWVEYEIQMPEEVDEKDRQGCQNRLETQQSASVTTAQQAPSADLR